MRTGGVILFFIMAVYVLRPVYPYIHYAWNKEYIAKYLCINKDKPELQCNGKCHLKKELSEQRKEEKGPAFPFKISYESIQLWHRIISGIQLDKFAKSVLNHCPVYKINYLYTLIRFVFHPPD